MIALREMVALSTEAKRLFRKNDSAEKNLAGYAKICWWNECVQLFQVFNNGIEKIYTMAKELQTNDLCKNSSKKIITLWEDHAVRSKIIVQQAAKIDYGMVFCKSCFNLEGDADGLAFVTGAEIKNSPK